MKIESNAIREVVTEQRKRRNLAAIHKIARPVDERKSESPK